MRFPPRNAESGVGRVVRNYVRTSVFFPEPRIVSDNTLSSNGLPLYLGPHRHLVRIHLQYDTRGVALRTSHSSPTIHILLFSFLDLPVTPRPLSLPHLTFILFRPQSCDSSEAILAVLRKQFSMSMRADYHHPQCHPLSLHYGPHQLWPSPIPPANWTRVRW